MTSFLAIFWITITSDKIVVQGSKQLHYSMKKYIYIRYVGVDAYRLFILYDFFMLLTKQQNRPLLDWLMISFTILHRLGVKIHALNVSNVNWYHCHWMFCKQLTFCIVHIGDKQYSCRVLLYIRTGTNYKGGTTGGIARFFRDLICHCILSRFHRIRMLQVR
jgi:hypothetical protein